MEPAMGEALHEALVARRWGEAVASGALCPFETEEQTVERAGARFVVRLARRFGEKTAPRDADPFAPPYDAGLFVADVSPTHACLFNKYPVLERHLLVVTRDFADQEAPLGEADFDALVAALAAVDGLGFYNAGPVAGASQRHRHLQVAPLPLARDVPGVPIEPLLETARYPAGGALGTVPAFAFAHRVARAAPSPGLYRRMLAALGLRERRGRLPAYNLLATRRWTLLVPRSREHFDGISVNALGFAGALLVPDETARARVVEAGPLAVLEAVGRPT